MCWVGSPSVEIERQVTTSELSSRFCWRLVWWVCFLLPAVRLYVGSLQAKCGAFLVTWVLRMFEFRQGFCQVGFWLWCLLLGEETLLGFSVSTTLHTPAFWTKDILRTEHCWDF